MGDQKDVFQFKDLTPEELAQVSKLTEENLPMYNVRMGPKGYLFTNEFKKYAADIYSMELRKGDIFVASYQRSGTTWTQELVWLLANDLDYAKAEAVPLTVRYPFLELVAFFNDDAIKYAKEMGGNSEEVNRMIEFMRTPAAKILAGMPSPRFVKTHLPMSLLSPKLLDTAKVVYVARDPRDVAVSCYHHAKLFKLMKFKASFKEMWNAFIKDLCGYKAWAKDKSMHCVLNLMFAVILTPYFEHVKEAWALRNHPNMLFLFYEDLSKDLPASIRRVADFLGKELTPEQMERLCDHLSIQNFKNNKSVNYEEMRELGFLDSKETFIRNGKTGGWREYFDAEMQQDADRWIAENLRDTDLRFPSMSY